MNSSFLQTWERLRTMDEPLLQMRERLAIPERIHQVLTLEAELVRHARSRLETARARLTTEAARLEAVSPLSVLARGYAIAYQFEGKRKRPIQDAARVAIGEKIEIQLRRGRLDATVDAATTGLEIWPDRNESNTGARGVGGDTTHGKGTQ